MVVISLEEAKARARALRPYVREAKRQGVQLTGRGKNLALSGEITPQELLSGDEELIKSKLEKVQPQNQTVVVPEQNQSYATQEQLNPIAATLASPEQLSQSQVSLYQTQIDTLKKRKDANTYAVRRDIRELENKIKIEQAGYTRREVRGGYVEVKDLPKSLQVKETVKSAFSLERQTVTADVNPKLALFIEEKASNPYLTAAELTFLKGAGGVAKSLVTKGVSVGAVGGTGVLSGLGKSALTFGRGLATSAGGAAVVSSSIKFSKLSQTEASILRTPEARTAIREAYAIQAGQQKGFFNQAKYGVSQFLGSQEQYKAGLIQAGVRQGFTNERLDLLVSGGLKTRTSQGYGEISGLLLAGVAGERAGRIAQTSIFAKYGARVSGSFGKSATLGALAVAPAGFIEGFSSEIVQQQTRSEQYNIVKAVKVGGVGAGSAALLGGAITGGIYAQKRGISKSAEIFGNIADVYEYPSDKLTDLAGFSFRGNIKGLSPTITLTPSFTNTLSYSGVVSQTPVSSKSLSSNFALTPTPTKTDNTPFSFTQTPVQPKTNPFTFTNTPTNPLTITNTQTNVPTQTQTNPLTITPTYTNTPTFSINYRFPAPLPIPTSFGGGGGGFSFGKGSPRIRKGYQYKPTVFKILTSKGLKI